MFFTSDEKTETKKSPGNPKKNVPTATPSNKAKVKKEQNTVSSNNAKKKPASKNDEVSFWYLYRLKFVLLVYLWSDHLY